MHVSDDDFMLYNLYYYNVQEWNEEHCSVLDLIHDQVEW